MKAPNLRESTTGESSRAVKSVSEYVKYENNGEFTEFIVARHGITSSESLYTACIESIHAAVDTVGQASPKLNDLLSVHIGSFIQTRSAEPHSTDF
jgi:hypothetical protein